MREGRCDCRVCRAYRLAIALALAGLLTLTGVCIHFLRHPAPGTIGTQLEGRG